MTGRKGRLRAASAFGRRSVPRCGRCFQIVGGLSDRCGNIFHNFRHAGDFCFGLRPFFGVHVLADGGNWFGAITSVGTGSVDLMPEPGAFGESAFGQEGALDFKKIGVY